MMFICKPFLVLTILKYTGAIYQQFKTPVYMNFIAQNLQEMLSDDTFTVINTHYTSSEEFIYSKPLIIDNNTVLTHSFINLNKPSDIFSKYLWLKMKRAESFNKCGKLNIAKEMNQWIFNEIFNKLPNYQQKKYNVYGKKMIFDTDIITKAEKRPEWLDYDLHIDSNKNNIIVKSPVMYTPIEGVPKRVAGMAYVKVISPEQVVDWVTHKSFQ